MLVDTHCHLNFQAFETDLDSVVQAAAKAGVKQIIIPGSDLTNSQKAIAIAQKYPRIYAAVGIHPHHVKNPSFQSNDWPAKIKADLRQLAQQPKVVAIGETGLDYYEYQLSKYPDNKITPAIKEKQKELFKIHLEIARQLQLPVIIHNREAHQDMLTLLDSDLKDLTGVFHCFSGDQEFLEAVLKQGFYAGIDGNLTYSKSVLKNAKRIPLDRLLLETDAPFLTPKPFQNERNQPKNVKIIAQYLANKLKIPVEKISQQTTANAQRLFKLCLEN